MNRINDLNDYRFDFKILYKMNGEIVKNLFLNENENTFKKFICELFLELPYQLYIDINNFWSWIDLQDYNQGDLILSLKSHKSFITVEVFKD